MSEYLPDRRDFLRAGAVGTLTALGFSTIGHGADARGKVFVRRDIASLSPDGPEMAAFRRGVRVMKSRPDSDPTSWNFQANIHGSNDKPAHAIWNTCQHGNYFFAPWHRMHNYFFERILRAASGDPDFAVPYWNYINPATRSLPLAFRQPADESNALYVAQRNPTYGGINNGAQLPACAAATVWVPFSFTNYIASDTSWFGFGGQASKAAHFGDPHGALETYHDVMHVLTGGSTGWMNDPNLAARDPIYWLHHNNVDRLWKRWLNLGGGRQNPTSNDAWMNKKFTFFDEHGKPVKMAVRECLDTEALGYRYDDDPPSSFNRSGLAAAVAPAQGGPSKPPTVLAASTSGPFVFGPPTLAATIDLKDDARREIETAIQRGGGPLLLNIEEVEHDGVPGCCYEVHVNLPPNVADPDYQSHHYVGNFAFVGLKPHNHADPDEEACERQPATRVFLITDTVQELMRRGQWDGRTVTVSIVQRGLVPPPGYKGPIEKPVVKASFKRVSIAKG